jgi:hypothetical protein
VSGLLAKEARLLLQHAELLQQSVSVKPFEVHDVFPSLVDFLEGSYGVE